MTDPHTKDQPDLDDLFDAARAHRPDAPADLTARIMADAVAEMPRPVARPAAQRGLLARILDAIGGWPAAAGLATATVAGLAIGVSSPDALDTLSGGFLAAQTDVYELEDLLPSYGDLLGEG